MSEFVLPGIMTLSGVLVALRACATDLVALRHDVTDPQVREAFNAAITMVDRLAARVSQGIEFPQGFITHVRPMPTNLAAAHLFRVEPALEWVHGSSLTVRVGHVVVVVHRDFDMRVRAWPATGDGYITHPVVLADVPFMTHSGHASDMLDVFATPAFAGYTARWGET